MTHASSEILSDGYPRLFMPNGYRIFKNSDIEIEYNSCPDVFDHYLVYSPKINVYGKIKSLSKDLTLHGFNCCLVRTAIESSISDGTISLLTVDGQRDYQAFGFLDNRRVLFPQFYNHPENKDVAHHLFAAIGDLGIELAAEFCKLL